MIEFIEALPRDLSATLQDQGLADDERIAVKFVLASVPLALESGELEYEGSEDHETFARISTDIKDASGTLYLTEEY